ncbi:MAG: 50S ribosomal protein L4 [Planctomycetia bacterium]
MTIDPAVFGGEVNRQLLHDAVVMYQANKRRGTHKAKARGEIAGSKKKMFRQKGTGNARVGMKRTHKRRGGGTAFGPLPRDYWYSMPKQQRKAATRMAILSKFLDNEAVIVDGLTLPGPKTKQMTAVLKALGVAEQSCLISTQGVDKNVYLSARNIERVEVLPAHELNAYVLLRRKRLVLTKPALEALLTFASEGEPSPAESAAVEAAPGGAN